MILDVNEIDLRVFTKYGSIGINPIGECEYNEKNRNIMIRNGILIEFRNEYYVDDRDSFFVDVVDYYKARKFDLSKSTKISQHRKYSETLEHVKCLEMIEDLTFRRKIKYVYEDQLKTIFQLGGGMLIGFGGYQVMKYLFERI